jgi:hypothetical protein
VADEKINVNITGDARSFLKASAEAQKAIEGLKRSAVSGIKLKLDTDDLKRQLRGLSATVLVKADTAAFDRTMAEIANKKYIARVGLVVNPQSINNAANAVGAAISAAVSSAMLGGGGGPRGGGGGGGFFGTAAATALGVRAGLGVPGGSRMGMVSGIPGGAASMGAALASSPFVRVRRTGRTGASAETVIPPAQPGTGAANPPGEEGLRFMQAGINPENIRAAARAVGELGGIAGQTVSRVLDVTSAVTGLSRGASGAALAVAALGLAFKTGYDHLQDVIDDERALIALQANFGTEFGRMKEAIDELAGAQPFIPDDQLANAATLLKTFGATQDQIESLLPAATALAIVYGKDIGEVAGSLARGLVGDTRSLKEFGIVLDGSADAGTRYTAILQHAQIATKQLGMFSRSTGSAMDGASLSVAKMNKAADDFNAAWGYAFAGPSKAINTFLEKLMDLGSLILTLGPVIGSFGRNAEAVQRLSDAFKNLTQGRGNKIELKIPEVKQLPGKLPGKITPGGRVSGGGTRVQVGGRELTTTTGLVPTTAPPKPPAPPKAPEEFDWLKVFRDKVAVKNLFGMGGSQATAAAWSETLAAGAKAGAKQTGLGFFSARAEAIGGNLGDLRKTAEMLMGGDLESQLANFPTALAIASQERATAQTAQQRDSAEEYIKKLKEANQENLDKKKKADDDAAKAINDGLTNALNDFIQAFADQIGRMLAGGGPMSAGSAVRGLGGVATQVLGAFGLGAFAPLATGLTTLLGGFFDQSDVNKELLQQSNDIQYDMYEKLAQIAVNTKTAPIGAKEALGLITPGQARIQAALGTFGAMPIAAGATLGAGEIIRGLGPITGAGSSGFQKLEAAVTDFLTGPGQGGDLPMRRLLSTLLNVPMEGLGYRVGDTGAQQELTNAILELFTGLKGMFKDEEQQKLDAELARIGSTPRNPVYVYDVTPADQRFTFQPREAFFRASARQAGSNVTPGAAISGGR